MEYVRCICVLLGAESGLGFGFTNPLRTGGGVLDECLCFGCGGVGD